MNILRLATVYDVVPGDLPPDLRVLSELDREAIADATGYFRKLARKAKPDWLRRLLREFAKSSWKMEFFAVGNRPYVPYFRFYTPGVAVSLPRGQDLPDGLPDVLTHFYAFLGGVQENDFGVSGGVDRPDQLCTVEEMDVPVHETNGIDPKAATIFLETYSGSRLCFLPDGGGAWLKAGKFEPVESLEAEVARYFEAILEGTRI